MKITNKNDLIENFIEQFRELDATNCFKNEMQYWFAKILQERFRNEQPILVCDMMEDAFGCEIDGQVYNITGNVTDQHDWEPWDEVVHLDATWSRRAYRTYADRVPKNVKICGHCDKFHLNQCDSCGGYNTVCCQEKS